LAESNERLASMYIKNGGCGSLTCWNN
jgi:hypothetical protein